MRVPTWLSCAFTGLFLGGLVGMAVGYGYFANQEMSGGETDLGEIFQWSLMGAIVFGVPVGVVLGTVAGMAAYWWMRRRIKGTE